VIREIQTGNIERKAISRQGIRGRRIRRETVGLSQSDPRIGEAELSVSKTSFGLKADRIHGAGIGNERVVMLAARGYFRESA